MSGPVVFDCLNCGAKVVASFDRNNGAEVKCSNCGEVIVFPQGGGQPFVKQSK